MDALQYATYPAGYASYFDGLAGDWRTAFQRQTEGLNGWTALLTDAHGQFAYAPGKWTVNQLLGHLADAERVFGYRAMAFARGEQAALPGFDEDLYVSHGGFEALGVSAAVELLQSARRANASLLRTMPAAAWGRAGTANQKAVSVEALFAVMTAHYAHHVRVLGERYGIALPF